VSLQVKSLEEELGVRLFERYGPMRVRATREAEILAGIVSPLLDGLEGVKKRFEEARGARGTSEIRIATHESVIAYFFPDILESIKKEQPDVRFQFFRKNKADIVEMVVSGDADFGVTTLEKVPRGVEYRIFRTHKRVLLAPKGHPLAKLARIRPKDIAAHPLILPPPQSETRLLVDSVFRKHGLEYQVSLELTGRDAVKKYIERGFGISIMNDYYVFPGDSDALAVLDVSSIFGETSRGVLYRKGRVFNPIQESLLAKLGVPAGPVRPRRAS
jgi:DNA-binding transcriptional LysR family regulator